MNHPEDEKAAEKWLVDNNWDYQKYGDKRGDRSAYDGLMNYEITGEVHTAFLAGCQHVRTSAEWKAMECVIEASRDAHEHCLCSRTTCGFDYQEVHSRLGKPNLGTRWLTPRDLISKALTKLDRIRKEGESG